ncbi:MAG: tetratricopeptide repeat protein [Deltaproteobacteria bacterium]|nr:tetratricopeptide repeat protein [Deltaproteobacteria bacterium]
MRMKRDMGLARSRCGSVLLALGFLACCIASSGSASAGTKQEAKRKAGEFFARGEALFDAGEYDKAAESFAQAYELAPHPSVLANIALSWERAGNLPAAVERWEQYLTSINDAETKERAKISDRLARLRTQVGELTVECPSARCVVHIDGTERGEAPLTVLLAAGAHHVEAFSDGSMLAAVDTQVEGGGRASVALSVPEGKPVEAVPAPAPVPPTAKGPVEQPVPQPAEKKDEGGIPLGLGFWISGGVAVAAGGCAIGFGVKTLKDEDEFKASGRLDKKIADEGKRDKIITNVMIGLTAAAAATAGGFAIYELFFKNKNEEPASSGDSTALVPGPGLGLGVAGRF